MKNIVRDWEIKGIETEALYQRIVKILLYPGLQNCKNLSLGVALIPSSGSTPLHSHDKEEEILFVISGRGECTVGAEQGRLEPGTAVYVPPRVHHQVLNKSYETLKVLWIMSPPGLELPYLKDVK